MINGHDRYIWELCKNMNCRQNCPQKFFFFRKEKNHMENQWSSRIGFILASAGAAIGLGAIWKFPYVAGMNGGAAFLIIFLFFTVLIGLPMLISEYLIGRSTGKEAVTAFDTLAPGTFWRIIGRFGVAGCFLLLSFYCVVGGWVLYYFISSLFGQVIRDGANYGAVFAEIAGSPFITLGSTAVYILLNVIVIALGVREGIERASKYLMPLLFVFFLILVIRALTLEGAFEGVKFFLSPDFSAITSEGVLYALGQSFFALAVGFSCMVTYSSYLKKNVSIPYSAGWVVIMNIIVSVMAGLVIFPVVFAFGYEPAEGPGLLFIVLPAVFDQIAFGEFFLSLFLVLFLIAALTSSFSLFEVIVAAFTADGKKERRKVTWMAGLVVFAAGIPAALSSGLLSDITLFDKSIFDLTDFLVSNIMLPLGNLLIALFIGYKMNRAVLKEEFFLGSALTGRWYSVWFFLMRTVVPVTIAIVLFNLTGIVG